MPAEHVFKNLPSLVAALQDALCSQLLRSLTRAKRSTLFLSGGSTPQLLYKALATQDLPWDRVSVALADERWVDVDHPASNERMLRETLLQGPAQACHFIGMKVAHPLETDREESAIALCNARYGALPKPWSAALLGMGVDGHTASLFPRAQGLHEAMTLQQPCMAIHALESAVTGPHTARMSLTAWSLLHCEQLFLLITGAEKRQVYEAARSSQEYDNLPIARFLQQTEVPLSVFWCP